jgi:hypothetical protein
MDHIFLMLETTVLSVKTAKLKRVSALRTNKKGQQLCSFEKVIEADDDKESVHTLMTGLENIMLQNNLGEKYVVISYFGQDFYRPMLEKYCKIANMKMPFTRAWIGLEQLAWPYAFDGKLRNRSIGALGELLEIKETEPLWLLYQCYWTLMRRLTTGVLMEDQARSHAGPLFEMGQKFLRQF